MNILITSDGPHALGFHRMSIAKAMDACGHSTYIWEINSNKPIYDVFDEIEPDIFLSQTYNLNRAIISCIKERPNLRVGLKASDFGNDIDLTKYPVLVANENEVKLTESIQDQVDFLEIHYPEKYLEQTHGEWIKRGFNVISVLMCCNIFDYTGGEVKEEFKTDCVFIGNRWPYKSQCLDRYILPLCDIYSKIKLKIFGQGWGGAYSCGYLPDEYVKHAYKSADIILNCHEAHSQQFGYDIISRPFNGAISGQLVISDYVAGLADIFGNGMVYGTSGEDYREKVIYYLANQTERESIAKLGYETCLGGHTAFHRVFHIFKTLGLEQEADNCTLTLEKYKGKLGL